MKHVAVSKLAANSGHVLPMFPFGRVCEQFAAYQVLVTETGSWRWRSLLKTLCQTVAVFLGGVRISDGLRIPMSEPPARGLDDGHLGRLHAAVWYPAA